MSFQWRNSGVDECGAVGWNRSGAAVIKAGDERGVSYIQYVEHEQDSPGGAVWVGECGHPVRPGSALELYLDVIPAGTPVPLQRNG